MANVAFIAAVNGHRVLVMDWDLEAPGLPYYFRGVIEGGDFKGFREAPGVLDLVWHWSKTVQGASSEVEIDNLIRSHDSGEIYENFVKNIVDFAEADSNGRLDYIGAGSPKIEIVDGTPYEEALANFSWTRFFEVEAGGGLISSFRNWAKANYDYVFIDSRTGLADVAGICTMLLPDQVALCFVLNRQNIDGVSKIAAAIRVAREDQIELRAVPMRVSQTGTSEENDAWAKARNQLTKIGGFFPEQVDDDFKLLGVNTAANVPFYETLAPFTASDIALDPLTLNYVRLAANITGQDLIAPNIDDHWLKRVQARLQPTHATIDYVEKLRAAEPERAINELFQLIESALDDHADGQVIEDDYVIALADTALGLAEESGYLAEEAIVAATNLIRTLYSEDQIKWGSFFIKTLESYRDYVGRYLDLEDEINMLEEIDLVLSSSSIKTNQVKRVQNGKRLARAYLILSNPEAASMTAGTIIDLAKQLSSSDANLPPDAREEMVVAEFDALLILADVSSTVKQLEKAKDVLLPAFERSQRADVGISRGERVRLRYEFCRRLAQISRVLDSPREGAHYAIEASKAVVWGGASTPNFLNSFIELAAIVLELEDGSEPLLDFLSPIVSSADRRTVLFFANHFSRSTRIGISFIELVEKVFSRLAHNSLSSDLQALGLLFRDIIVQLTLAMERKRKTINNALWTEYISRATNVLDIIASLDVPVPSLTEMIMHRDGSLKLPPRAPR